MRSQYHRVHYRAMPTRSRYGYLSIFSKESCYTAEELQFRTSILAARESSHLDPELLQTSHSWFAKDQGTAFINVNENSWFFSPAYLPRQELSTDDFHIGLIDSQRVSWQELGTMTRTIGDYLLLRNENLIADYLNQPMNYILLDIVQILRRLAMTNNPEYVAKQLPLLQNYLRTIEIHTSPTMGSDRLFLADCRRTIELQQTEIENKINSQQLRIRIHQVQQQLNHVAELRHTVLHFALAEDPVNPHPYWEHFKKNSLLESKKEFPTLAAKACATSHADELTKANDKTSGQTSILTLSEEDLTHCQDFKFVSSLPDTAKIAYSNSVVELQEILRFQSILDQLLQLFDQAGEVFTVIQFREQMLGLLKNIEQFMQYSQQNIMKVIETNTDLYHEYIQAKQDLTWWQKLVTNKQVQIDNFIYNQDNLARFDTTPSDLNLSSKELILHINQIITQLTEQASEIKQLELVNSTRELAQQLMNSMHAWVGRQHELKGLPIPEKPKLVDSSKPLGKPEGGRCGQAIPCIVSEESYENEPVISSANQLAPLFQFWSSSSTIRQPALICASNSDHCGSSTTPVLPASETGDQDIPSSQSSLNTHLALGFLVLLPLGILALKLLYDAWQKPAVVISEVSQTEFEEIAIKVADLLSINNGLVAEYKDIFYQTSLTHLNDDYDELLGDAREGKYDLSGMKALYEELEELYKELGGTKMKLN